MLDTTKAALSAILKSDGTATQWERAAIAAIIDGDDAAAEMPRLLTRKQVAKLINRTTRMVDYFGEKGFIRRVKLGDNSRASGFDAESVRLFLKGQAPTGQSGGEPPANGE